MERGGRVIEVEEREVVIEFEAGCRCSAVVHMRNTRKTHYAAFKIQTTSPDKFSVKPPNGFIPPSSHCSFQILLKPQWDLPETFPVSGERFLVKSVPVLESVAGQLPERVPDNWFSHRKEQVQVDAKLKVVFTGDLLLRYLVARNDCNSVRQILKRQPCRNLPDKNGRTPVHMAAASGDVEMLLALLDSGAHADGLPSNSKPNTDSNLNTDSNPNTNSKCNSDINSNPNSNNNSNSGSGSVEVATPLLEAVYLGHAGAVRALLSHGANPNVHNERGLAPVHLAATWDNAHVLFLLLRTGGGADVDARDPEGRTALHCAAGEGQLESVKVLLEAGADKDAQSSDGRTALYRAAAKGFANIARVLLDWGANPHIRAASGHSPLDIAIERGQVSIVDVLQLGEQLLRAARRGDLEALTTSLDMDGGMSDLKLNRCDQYGWTALHCACFKGHTHLVTKLLHHGADLHCKDIEGHTPLHCAVEGGHMDVIELLLTEGADIHMKNERGATPLEIATTMGYPTIAKRLSLHPNSNKVEANKPLTKLSRFLSLPPPRPCSPSPVTLPPCSPSPYTSTSRRSSSSLATQCRYPWAPTKSAPKGNQLLSPPLDVMKLVSHSNDADIARPFINLLRQDHF